MKDKLAMAIAWRLPRRLVYWVIVRVAALHRNGTPANYPADRTAEQIVKEWL